MPLFTLGKRGGQIPTNVYREVLFDQPASRLKVLPGEELVLQVDDIEDTKAGKFERGTLKITSLRVIWTSSQATGINLTIGLQTITKLDVSNRMRSGSTAAIYVPPLHMLSGYKTTKFEFIFTPRTRGKSHELLQTVEVLVREFNATTGYRDVRMRAHLTAAIGNFKELILLHKEDLIERVDGVMNLSKDYGQLGTLWVSNLRITWAATLQDNYNCSVPFLQLRKYVYHEQVKSLKSQQTKFGTVLVVETLPQPQRLLLGFQINPANRLQELLHQLNGLLQSNRANPVFGVQVSQVVDPDVYEDPEEADIRAQSSYQEEQEEEDDEDDEDEEDHVPGDGLMAYCASSPAGGGETVFDESIGLTVEAMPRDVTLKSLWSVL